MWKLSIILFYVLPAFLGAGSSFPLDQFGTMLHVLILLPSYLNKRNECKWMGRRLGREGRKKRTWEGRKRILLKGDFSLPSWQFVKSRCSILMRAGCCYTTRVILSQKWPVLKPWLSNFETLSLETRRSSQIPCGFSVEHRAWLRRPRAQRTRAPPVGHLLSSWGQCGTVWWCEDVSPFLSELSQAYVAKYLKTPHICFSWL